MSMNEPDELPIPEAQLDELADYYDGHDTAADHTEWTEER